MRVACISSSGSGDETSESISVDMDKYPDILLYEPEPESSDSIALSSGIPHAILALLSLIVIELEYFTVASSRSYTGAVGLDDFQKAIGLGSVEFDLASSFQGPSISAFLKLWYRSVHYLVFLSMLVYTRFVKPIDLRNVSLSYWVSMCIHIFFYVTMPVAPPRKLIWYLSGFISGDFTDELTVPSLRMTFCIIFLIYCSYPVAAAGSLAMILAIPVMAMFLYFTIIAELATGNGWVMGILVSVLVAGFGIAVSTPSTSIARYIASLRVQQKAEL